MALEGERWRGRRDGREVARADPDDGRIVLARRGDHVASRRPRPGPQEVLGEECQPLSRRIEPVESELVGTIAVVLPAERPRPGHRPALASDIPDEAGPSHRDEVAGQRKAGHDAGLSLGLDGAEDAEGVLAAAEAGNRGPPGLRRRDTAPTERRSGRPHSWPFASTTHGGFSRGRPTEPAKAPTMPPVAARTSRRQGVVSGTIDHQRR